MVEDMRTAFDFSKEANKLNDSTEMLKPIVKKLLGLAIDCSRFVQDYAKHNLLGMSPSRRDLSPSIEMNLNCRANESSAQC